MSRILPVGYYTLTEVPNIIASPPDLLNEGSQWWPLHEIPPLLFGNDKMVEKALSTLLLHLISKQKD
jgi:8-oxo-dGTP diphosphatase